MLITREGINPFSNTGAVGFPGRPLTNAGLGALPEELDLSTMSTWEKFITAWNSQRVFDLNLERAEKGLPPIATNLAAPTVNVGLNAQTQQTLMIAALAIGALFLLGRKSR